MAEPVSGRWLRHVPIPLELARETIEALYEEGFGLNCYVDDGLYVAEVTPEARRYADFRTSSFIRSETCAPGSSEPPTKLVVIDEPEVLDGLKVRMQSASTVGCTSRSRCRISSSSPRRR